VPRAIKLASLRCCGFPPNQIGPLPQERQRPQSCPHTALCG
jgi:hypothetical protein